MKYFPASANAFADKNQLQDLTSRIACHAWQLWRNYQRPAGCEAKIWLEAERHVRAIDSGRRAADSPAGNRAPVGADAANDAAQLPFDRPKTAPCY